MRNLGDVDSAFANAAKVHEAEYYTPLLAHASMEPPVAVADFKDGKVEAWAPTQNPQAVQETVAAALGIDKKNVICHVTLLGGAFGRKSKPDYVAEAAVLSRRRWASPSRWCWSREEDIGFDYLSLDGGDVSESRTRLVGKAHGVAASQRVPSHRLDFQHLGPLRR